MGKGHGKRGGKRKRCISETARLNVEASIFKNLLSPNQKGSRKVTSEWRA